MAASSQILQPTSSAGPSSGESSADDWPQHLVPWSGETDYCTGLVAPAYRELAACWAPCLSTLSTLPHLIWVFSSLCMWKGWGCENGLVRVIQQGFRPLAASAARLFTCFTVSHVIQRMRDRSQGRIRANIHSTGPHQCGCNDFLISKRVTH